VIFGSHVIETALRGKSCNLGQDTQIFAGMFQFFYLRLAIFFGCLMVFLSLFRGEMRDRTLHYLLLTPIRREVLVVGKYLGALMGTAVIFCLGVLAVFFVLAWHFGFGAFSEWLLRGGGLQQLAAYLGATVMACVGYGSVFLLFGVMFKNPIVPAGALLVWEQISPILPALLKKFSVLYYLRSLCPVDVQLDNDVPAFIALLVVNTSPLPAWIAVTGLLALTAAVLAYAGIRSRRMEIAYSSE
jgi:ABC-type transport system involved in multi-copper enzyme maturation permease subunit